MGSHQIQPAVPPLREVHGLGVLACHGPLTLLCAPAPAQYPNVGALVDALATAALSDGASGRRLSQLLADLLGTAGPGEFPALCALGPAERGLTVVVHGPAELMLTTGGQLLQVDGRGAMPLAARTVTGPVDAIYARIGEQDRCLRVGWSTRDGASAQSQDPKPADRPAPPSPAMPAEPADRIPPHPVTDGRTNLPRVTGVCCREGHFNDPAVAYCAICGAAMVPIEQTPLWGDRPQLGVLVLDDGAVIALRQDQVLGRLPEFDPAVGSGSASPVRLPDPRVAPVQARLVLDGWRVRVVGEADGTTVRGPGDTAWIRLPEGGSVELRSGTAIACGTRELHYYSYRSAFSD